MIFAQYYDIKNDGQRGEKLGSDGVSPLDGRKSMLSLINDARKIKDKRKNVTCIDNYFEIRQGKYSNYVTLYKGE